MQGKTDITAKPTPVINTDKNEKQVIREKIAIMRKRNSRRINMFRRQKGWSIEEFAHILGRSYGWASEIMNGKTSLGCDELFYLIEEHDFPIDILLHDNGDSDETIDLLEAINEITRSIVGKTGEVRSVEEIRKAWEQIQKLTSQ